MNTTNSMSASTAFSEVELPIPACIAKLCLVTLLVETCHCYTEQREGGGFWTTTTVQNMVTNVEEDMQFAPDGRDNVLIQ